VALHRRAIQQPENIETLEIGDFNSKAKTVERVKSIVLTMEFKLLLYLVRNKEMIVSRTNLRQCLGYNFDMNTNVVDVYINYLRKSRQTLGQN
jgi:DNA-binding response OmpR family regulator